jgi:hypothetical protein
MFSCFLDVSKKQLLKDKQRLFTFHTRMSTLAAALVFAYRLRTQNHTTIVMPSSSSRGNRAGRVQSCHSVPVLGENLPDVGEDCNNALHDTAQQGMDDKC